MRKRKLKKYVLPSLSGILLSIIVICLGLMSKNLSNNVRYEYDDIQEVETVLPVYEEVKKIAKPVEDNINITNKYYSKDDEKKVQQESLIFFNDTYMPSTGFSYTASESFKAYNTYDGVIKSIEKDELLGNVVTIDHGNNIITIYYSIDNIGYKVGDLVPGGEIIGDSAKNQIYGESYALLFEVSIDGKLINPDNFFAMDINNY